MNPITHPVHPLEAVAGLPHGESYLFRHRGMARATDRVRVPAMLGLGVLGMAAWLAILPLAGRGWTRLLHAFGSGTGIFERLVEVQFVLGQRTVLVLPEMEFSAWQPGWPALAVHALILAVVLAASFRLGSERAPLVYFLRAIVLIHGSSVVFHALPGRQLPYDPGAYVSGMLSVGVFLIALIPIVLSATHFLFDFAPWKKVGLMVTVMGWMYLLVPVKYAVQALVLHHGGMIFLPILFILFGLPIEVFLFIALYAWGMSWHERRPIPFQPVRPIRPGLADDASGAVPLAA